MSFWDLFGKSKETKMQLFLHDDDSMEFRRLEIDFTVLIEKVNKKINAAFKHFYKMEYDFEGYKNIPAGKVTLGFPRDVVCDVFNSLDENKDGIKKGTNLDRPWITEISKNAFYKAKTQKSQGLFMDRFSTACLFIVIAEAIGIIIQVAV